MSYFADIEDLIFYGRLRFTRNNGRYAKQSPPDCPYCGKRTHLTDGAKVYPRRPDLANKLFYLCTPCDAFVGCHPGTERPLGVPANAALRSARQAAHRAFDPMWRRGGMSRGAAYSWLAHSLGIPAHDCHIGLFDEHTCERVIALCVADDFEVQE